MNEAFLKDVLSDWEAHGAAAIASARPLWAILGHEAADALAPKTDFRPLDSSVGKAP